MMEKNIILTLTCFSYGSLLVRQRRQIMMLNLIRLIPGKVLTNAVGEIYLFYAQSKRSEHTKVE